MPACSVAIAKRRIDKFSREAFGEAPEYLVTPLPVIYFPAGIPRSSASGMNGGESNFSDRGALAPRRNTSRLCLEVVYCPFFNLRILVPSPKDSPFLSLRTVPRPYCEELLPLSRSLRTPLSIRSRLLIILICIYS